MLNKYPEIKHTPHSLATYQKRDLIDRLKMGSCLASAWLYTAAMSAVLITNTHEDYRPVVLGGVLAMGLASSIGKGFVSKLFEDKSAVSQTPVTYKKPPEELAFMHSDLSMKMGVPRYVRLRYFSNSPQLAYYNYHAQNISVSENVYRKLDYQENRFVMAHELAHVHNEDENLHNLTRVPIYTSIGMAPFMPSAFAAFGTGSLSMAFAAVGGTLVGILGCAFTKAASQKAHRYSEYRADRKAVMTEGSPLSAISALAKLDRPLKAKKWALKNIGKWVKSDINDHPSRNQRIIAIARDFSEAHPNLQLNLYYSRTRYGTVENAPILYVDATQIDGKIYYANSYNFAETAQGVNDLTKIKIVSRQPRFNPL